MAEQRGKLLTCDRCGETVFLKELEAKARDADGGYTRWNEYKHEEPPEGWSYKYFGDYSNSYSLCPKCSEKFEEAHTNFFRIVKEKN